MQSVNVAKLKNQLSKYLTFAKGGEEIAIRDRNLPGAKLVPFSKFRRRLDVPQLESIIDRIEDGIRQQEPTFARVFIEADPLKGFTRLPRVA
jgi:antitoxin (DNA-binding transcriptional repressor) of toxin-antitoxin stability system